jgi:hypothetical protein
MQVREVRIDETGRKWGHKRRKSVKLEFLKRAKAVELSAQLQDGYGIRYRAIDLIQAKERTKQTRARRKA